MSWPVTALAQPPAAAGPGTAVAEETSPEIHRLDLAGCGLRDEGDALGSLSTQVWAWPGEQWWVEIQRAHAPMQTVSLQGELARGTTRCRVECDGRPDDAAGLARGFESGLDAAVADALRRLAADWARAPGLEQPVLEAEFGLLLGKAALSWGWHLGAGGMDGRALMRALGVLEMQACFADLRLEGELTLDGARSRITLACRQAAPLTLQLRREADEPPLLAAMQDAKVSFRLPLQADVVPLGSDSGALVQAAGPCTGALAGEAGLRPRTRGGSGFEWFASLRLEPVNLPVQCFDPLLGAQRRTLALVPARALIDWSLS